MKKRIKVGLFIDCFYPMIDGVIQVVDQYATILSRWCDVTVFTVKPRKDQEDTRNHIYKVVRSKIVKIPFLDYDLAIPSCDKKFKKILNESNLDIVHIHDPFAIGKVGLKYARKHNIPVIASMHSQYKQDFYKETKSKFLTNFMLKKIMKVYNACDKCYAVNEAISKLYYEEYGANNKPEILRNATEFKPVDDANQANRTIEHTYKIPSDMPLFLFVGRLIDIKNICFIAKSLKIVKDKGYKFKMMYVGTGPDETKLKNLVHDLGLENDIIFTGKISDRQLLLSIYSRANLFLFPSMYDANSLVQIEAASQKTPTVFLEGSATSSSVTKNVNAYISPNSEIEYANTICNILDNPEQYKIICENAYNDLYRSWEDVVSEVYDLYLKLIDENKT